MTLRFPFILSIARLLLLIAYPVLLVMLGVRLVMTPAFLQFEYTRPDFPRDFYGMTTEERLTYAPYALTYLVEVRPIEYLADLTFAEGGLLFNTRELHHMRDVQTVTVAAFLVAAVLGLLAIAAALLLLRAGRLKDVLITLRRAALATLALIALIVILAITGWEFFFVTFHRLFFADGTWVFEWSDTLIRLFPEQFWFDAALAIGSISVMLSVVTLILTSLVLRRMTRAERDNRSSSFDIPAR